MFIYRHVLFTSSRLVVFGGRERECQKRSFVKTSRLKISKSGTIQEARKREFYEKPSVKRKKKSEAARKRKF